MVEINDLVAAKSWAEEKGVDYSRMTRAFRRGDKVPGLLQVAGSYVMVKDTDPEEVKSALPEPGRRVGGPHPDRPGLKWFIYCSENLIDEIQETYSEDEVEVVDPRALRRQRKAERKEEAEEEGEPAPEEDEDDPFAGL